MELIRSLLFVPGIRQRFIEKAPTVPADLVCIDLEDSVAPAEKPKARTVVREAIPTMPRTGYRLFVRVNALETGLLEEDLDAVVSEHLDGISLPKVHNADIVRRVDAYLGFLEKTRGLPMGQVKIIPWIETAQGLMQVGNILRASSRLVGASFGAEDFATDMEIQRTSGSKEIAWARYMVATACRAADVLAVDTPEPDFRDLAHLREDALFARSVGFRGKYCIHPDQVPVVNEIFGPAEAELSWAREAVRAYEEGEREGLGAISLDGVMIDRPIYSRALRLLEWAERVGQASQRAGGS